MLKLSWYGSQDVQVHWNSVPRLSYMELSAHLPAAGAAYAFCYHLLGEVFAVFGAALITLEYGSLRMLFFGLETKDFGSSRSGKLGREVQDTVQQLQYCPLFVNVNPFDADSKAQYLIMRLGPVTVSFPALVVLGCNSGLRPCVRS